ncbi:MAG: ABC transporter permease, partial [Actinomycetia bacterium]|nr:ABC transporter permease [Actinomycetes bacterium]
LFLPVVAALAALAARLAARRDLGAGLLRERAGRPTARPGLRGPAALTWRLQRGQWYGWGAGVAALALACGPIATQAQTLVSSNDTVRKVMAAKGGDNSAINGFTTVVVLYLAILAACAALNSLSGLASEESGGAGEALLARPISRARLVGARLAVATAGAVGLQLIGSALLAGAESASGASGFAGVFAAGASYLPALALFAAISAALFALAPKAQPAAWVFVSWSVIGSLFAAVLSLPGWTLDLAPLSATPGAPAAPITATPLVVMTVLAALLGALAMAAIRRRDYGAQT